MCDVEMVSVVPHRSEQVAREVLAAHAAELRQWGSYSHIARTYLARLAHVSHWG